MAQNGLVSIEYEFSRDVTNHAIQKLTGNLQHLVLLRQHITSVTGDGPTNRRP
jgi:hypothetical protein